MNAIVRAVRASEAAPSQALSAALEADKREGLALAVRARWAALAVIAVFVVAINFGEWHVVWYLGLLAAFAAIGWAQMRFGRVGRSRVELNLIVADLILMTIVALVPNPLVGAPWPPALQYQLGGFLYFFVLVAGATLAYSWRTFFAYGTWTVMLWCVGTWWVMTRPEVYGAVPAAIAPIVGDNVFAAKFLDPNHVDLVARAQELIVFAIVCGILAVNGWRTHRLIVRQAAAARERANLARHFAPSMVDTLAERDQPLGTVREQPVAVLFADIVGFTQFAERRPPDEVVATLRQFHGYLEACVFEHRGTLDKFLGDGLMATFGTPDPAPDDAGRALACALAMQAAIGTWNAARGRQGEPPIRLSVGLHFGPVVIGDIGSARRLEYAVLGDTVNVANRLEALTRSLDVRIAASADLVRAARAAGARGLAHLAEAGPQRLRGRNDAIEVWTCA